jgi:uncharacterized integral membrane protein
MPNFIKSIFRIFSKVVFITIVAIIVVFCLNNHQEVEISLSPFPFLIEARLFLIIIFCFFGGVLIGFFGASITITKEKFRNFVNSYKIKFLKRKIDKIDAKK